MFRRMRTTVRLPDDLHARAKQLASEAGITFTDLLEEALRLVLRDDVAAERPPAYRVRPLPAGDGVHPGIDLTDSAALLDHMGGR